MKSEYRNFDSVTGQDIKDDIEAGSNGENTEYVEFDDVTSMIDSIESEIDVIIDAIEDDYDLKDALRMLKELKEKLY